MAKQKEMTRAQDLSNWLYDACNILRGKIGHENFKDYLTPLLYFKRIDDVWNEEHRRALADSGNDEEYARLYESQFVK